MNDRIMPGRISVHSVPVKSPRFFISFSRVAPSMVGMARKKENSAAAGLLKPRIMAPMMVAADLDVPGTMARHWKRPIIMIVV